VTLAAFFLLNIFRVTDQFIEDYLLVNLLRAWGRTLITCIEYYFVYAMLRVYQKLNSEGHKEYKEKQCIARVFLVSSVSISILNTIMGSLRYNI
jgi:hypothetical protein